MSASEKGSPLAAASLPYLCFLAFIQKGKVHLINPQTTNGETEDQHRRIGTAPFTRGLGKQDKEQTLAYVPSHTTRMKML